MIIIINVRDLIGLAKRAYKRKGISYLISNGLRFASNIVSSRISYWYHNKIYSNKTFEFRGKIYNYYFHPRGQTWKTERAVEMPLIWTIVQEYRNLNKRILEVGNVLSYRFETNHDILDKNEMVRGVINDDVVSYSTDNPYDLIVSISTMEHVGWDELPRDPSKLLKGIQNLNSLLSHSGKMVITLPLVQNLYLDELKQKCNDFR